MRLHPLRFLCVKIYLRMGFRTAGSQGHRRYTQSKYARLDSLVGLLFAVLARPAVTLEAGSAADHVELYCLAAYHLSNPNH